MSIKKVTPWVIVSPEGLYWVGHASGEDDAWSVALGWPDAAEVTWHKDHGWYAAEAQVSWTKEQA